MFLLEQECSYQTTSKTITDLQTFQMMTIYAFFDVWLFIKVPIDIDVNVKPKDCLMIIVFILILFITILLV